MVTIRGKSRFDLFLYSGIVALAYYAGAKIGLAYAVVGGAISLVWPSSGIALVLLFVLGFAAAPGIAIGSFLANVSGGVPVAVAAVIGMARALGMTTIGEGIETVEQFRCLCELGCDQGQGYLFSPPMTAELFQATHLAQAMRDESTPPDAAS